MITEQLTNYLSDNGIEIWDGQLPQSDTNGVYIVPNPSPAPDVAIGYYELMCTFWSINENTKHGRDDLKAIFDLLHRKTNYDIEGNHIYLSVATSVIIDLDRDTENRKIQQLPFRFIYRENT